MEESEPINCFLAMWNGYSSKMLRDFLNCVLYVKTLELPSMKIITEIYKEICMAGQGKQK